MPRIEMALSIRFPPLLPFLAALLSPAPAAALTIEFDYGFDSGFFAASAAARSTLEAAGDFFAERINDSLLGFDSSGGNQAVGGFHHPSTGGTALLPALDLAADTIRVIAGARDLPGNRLAEAAPGWYASLTGSPQFQLTVEARGQGEVATVKGMTATDFAPWGGSIAFDSNVNWNFGLLDGPSGTQFDFLSVALHELGHVFGVGTAWSWDNQVDALDRFTGEAARAVFGTDVPLEPDANHWANGTASLVAAGPEAWIATAGAAQETAFDPTLQRGRRKLMTDLDVAALSDIGWEVAPPGPDPEAIPPQVVPVPVFASILLGALIALAGIRLSPTPRS